MNMVSILSFNCWCWIKCENFYSEMVEEYDDDDDSFLYVETERGKISFKF